jgi:predicted transglutaminase-like cysteine proteinase
MAEEFMSEMRRFRACGLTILAIAAGLAMGWSVVGPASAAAEKAKASPSFFKTVETQSDNMKPFKKWTTALTRYTKAEAEQKGGCDSKKFNKCHYDEWIAFLDTVRGMDKLAQLKAVNKQMNKSKYIVDQANWGTKDYWATPFEFMAKFGDCEDYAITKFMSLKQLGYDAKDLRVVAVKDMNLRVGHAILAVFLDGKVYILDNQVKIVVEAKKIRHYQPVFSISETHWWRHRAAT